jgi:hypothetical protein
MMKMSRIVYRLKRNEKGFKFKRASSPPPSPRLSPSMTLSWNLLPFNRPSRRKTSDSAKTAVLGSVSKKGSVDEKD